ncbi:unnamed protein product [Clonostachys rosea f. rosea IK726]|uniref:Capsule polysaccharide biosynthesis protein n=2 Tax=Bionectria ochroleuca TaxID=29856 RepID=A0A0B7KIV6_BIOOC|nr:unnamed protein product [Clonostachys rosea f. rosea IK726]
MEPLTYPIPQGLHKVPDYLFDNRPDAEIDAELLNPPPVKDVKNVWFFWHSGFSSMHGYTQRNVRAWYRRLSKSGWVIRVLDRQPSSPLNIDQFLDTSDPETFPKAFVDGAIGGTYGIQHTSDLVRWPLLLKYGGVYADVGMLQIGDLDRLWNKTLGNPESPYEVLAYYNGNETRHEVTNYLLASTPNNPLFARCHKLFLALWAEDGGKTSTDGMHASPLMKPLPLMKAPVTLEFEEDGKKYGHEEVSKLLTDYIIQCQTLTLVMGLVDEEDGWNGPEYTAKHLFAIEYMEGSQLINVFTGWNGPKAWELMSLPLPKEGETETEEQKKAKEIVQGCLQRSWGFKLAHGLIVRVMGPTLGSLWRANPGSDNVPGTYAHWLRYGIEHWSPDHDPASLELKVLPPIKKGSLLKETLG